MLIISVPDIDLKTGHLTRWETSSRYYELRLFQDLFGTPIALRIWGLRDGTGHHELRTILASDTECLLMYRAVAKRLASRSYQLCKTL